MRNKTLALILAAGKGTRLNSKYPKPLVPVLGVPMLHRVINTFESLSDIDIGVVIGNRSDEILKTLNSKIQYVYQRRQLGTAHAVKESKDLIDKYEKVFIMPADSVLINKSHIDDLINSHFTSNASCSFFSADFPFELPYAKIIRNNGNLIGCVEDIDANEKQKQIREFFTRYAYPGTYLLTYLPAAEELVRLTLAGSFDRARALRSKLHVNGIHGRCLGIQ